MSNFDNAFNRVIGHEGGFQNDPLDRVLFLAERLQYFTEVKTWKTYCTGWTRRVVQNLRYAAEDN